MSGKAVGVAHRAAQHDDADMVVNCLGCWHGVAVFQRPQQRARISSASAHHSASQNMGWVMADSSFEKRNIWSALVVLICRR